MSDSEPRLRRPQDLTATFSEDGRLLLRSSTLEGAEVLAPAQAAPLLAFCTAPRTRAEVVGAFGPQAGVAWDVMAEGGLLVPPEASADTPDFFSTFSGLDIHRRMLDDAPRVEGYLAAIRRAVAPGMAVLDAGTGTGVLACAAALAGAARVYAVDRSDILRATRAVVEASGVADRVMLVQGDLRSIALPERVDLVITETFGALALAEGGIDDVTACCARNLAPGGRVIPGAARVCFAPVVSTEGLESPWHIFGLRGGVDLRPLRGQALVRGFPAALPPEALGHPGAEVATLGLPRGDNGPCRGEARFEGVSGEVLWGWAGWFDLDLLPDLALPTGPAAPLTHWKQTFLPCPPLPLEPGAPLALSVALEPAPGDRRAVQATLSWRQGPNEARARWRIV